MLDCLRDLATLYHGQKLLASWKDCYEWRNGEESKAAVTYLTASFWNLSATSVYKARIAQLV